MKRTRLYQVIAALDAQDQTLLEQVKKIKEALQHLHLWEAPGNHNLAFHLVGVIDSLESGYKPGAQRHWWTLMDAYWKGRFWWYNVEQGLKDHRAYRELRAYVKLVEKSFTGV